MDECTKSLNLVISDVDVCTNSLMLFSSDVNECASTPCQNGASCVDVVNMYNCTCAAGYTGVHCETGTYS